MPLGIGEAYNIIMRILGQYEAGPAFQAATRDMQSMAGAAVQASTSMGGFTNTTALGNLRKLSDETKKTTTAYDQMGNYVRRAAVAFAAFKALDIMRDFTVATIETTKATETFTAAMGAVAPAGVTAAGALAEMRAQTSGLMSDMDLLKTGTILFSAGLAGNSEEAGKLAQAGMVLTTVFESNQATMDKYYRLLQNGSKLLYDNFGLSTQYIVTLTDQIEATTGLSNAEAKQIAVRQAVIEKSEQLKDSLGATTTASKEFDTAWSNFIASVGKDISPAFVTLVTDMRWVLELLTVARQRQVEMNDVFAASPEVLAFLNDELMTTIVVTGEAADETAAFTAGLYVNQDAVRETGVSLRDLGVDLNTLYNKWAAGREAMQAFQRQYQPFPEKTGLSETLMDQAIALDDYRRKFTKTEKSWFEESGLATQEYLNKQREMYLQTQIDILVSVSERVKAEEELADRMHYLHVSNAADIQNFTSDQQQAYYDLYSSIGGYFSDMTSLQKDYKQSMGDLASSSWDAANEADDKRLDYTASFNEKVGDLEVDRAEKIKWVRDGAWKRTKEEEAAAELWWNNIYDQKERDDKAHYDRQMKDATEAEEKRQAEIAKQQAREKEAYDENLKHLKLVAALTVVEMSGQLQSLTGGMVKTAEDAAKLIEARYLKPSDALLAAIAGASQGILDLNANATKNIEDSAPALADALTGKFGAPVTILNNAIASIPPTFDTMANLVATSAVMAGGAVDGLTGRTTEATTGVEGIGTAWSDLLKKASPNIMNLKKRIQNDMIDKLVTTTTEAGNAATGISGTWTDTKDDTSKLVARFAEMEQGLKYVQKAAVAVGVAIGNIGTTVPTYTPQSPSQTGAVPTPRGSVIPAGSGWQGQYGGSFEVPPGYSKDNFPVFVSSGEHVTVIPKNKVAKFAGGTGGQPWFKGVAPEIAQMRLASIQGEVFKKIERMVKENAATFADYFKELRDLQQRAIDDEKAFNETIAGIRKDAKAEEKGLTKDYNKDITDLEKKRHDEIAALDADAWGITNEEYTVALAAINATYDEKKKVIADAYKEQVAAIVQGEAEKLAEEQAAYAKSREEYVDNLKRLKLIAALSVLETSGVLQEYTHGWAKTADEAATLIESGLLPISKEFATAIGTAMQGMTNSTAQANKVLAQNKKTIAGLTGMTYAPNAQVGAMLPNYPNTPIGALMSGVGTSIAQYTGDWQSFIKFFSGLNIDAILAGMRGGGGHKDKLLREALTPYYNIPTNKTVFGQHGLDMIVPPGYARDNFPVYVSSGERVTVTPPGMSRTNQINITGNWNPQTEGDLMRYVRISQLMGR